MVNKIKNNGGFIVAFIILYKYGYRIGLIVKSANCDIIEIKIKDIFRISLTAGDDKNGSNKKKTGDRKKISR